MKPSKASFCGCGLGSPQLGHWLSERHLESTFTESIHGWYRVSPVDGEFLSRHICCLAQCWACWHAYESPGGVLKEDSHSAGLGSKLMHFSQTSKLLVYGSHFKQQDHTFFVWLGNYLKKKKSSKESYHRQKRYSSSFHTEILICNNSSSQSIQKTSQAVLMNAKSEIMGQLR